MNRLPFLICLAAAGLLPIHAGAQEDATSSQVAAFNMNPLVVTSTLGVETVEESLSSVTVIDSEALSNRDPKEMNDVLSAQPGINVISNGGFGKNTSVYTRGTSGESTLLLLDGIRLRSASSGSAPWQFIPPQLLRRIEIVRGPRGSLYGADAVGGVIQGFTTPREGGDRKWVEAGGGSFATQEYGAGISGSDEGTEYSLQGHYLDTDGTNIRPGGEDKGYRNAAGTVSVNHEFDNGASLGVLGLHSRGRTEFDGGETDFAMQTVGVKGALPVTDYWTASAQVSEARDNQDQVGEESYFDTRTRTARLKNTFQLGRHEFIAGTEYRVDELDALGLDMSGQPAPFEKDSRDNRAVFGQWLSGYGPVELQLSGRRDDNEAYGEETTGAAAIGLDLDDAHVLRASYGTAFRAPTFNDLYYPGYGNPDLDPETSETTELGLRGNYEHVFWDLAIYRTDVDDLIEYSATAGQPDNIARARIEGAELSGGLQWSSLELRSSLTVQDPVDRETGNELARRPTRSFRMDATYNLNRYRFGATVVAEGDRYNDGENTEEIPGYATLDLRAGMDVTDQLSLSLNLENVLDRRYSTARATPFSSPDFNYLAPGRAVYATIRYGAQ